MFSRSQKATINKQINPERSFLCKNLTVLEKESIKVETPVF